MNSLKSIEKANVRGKTVLIRVDYNVPVHEGKILDYTRIDASLPTIEYLISNDAKIILVAHFGRPGGKVDPQYSIQFLIHVLEKKLGAPVTFCSRADKLEKCIKDTKEGSCILLENIRFEEGEEKNSTELAQMLAKHCDIYVNDAFSCAHRNHASTHAIANFLPSFAGISLLNEVENLDKALKKDPANTIIIVAGKKVSTKFKVLQNLADKCSKIIIAGAMANTFHAALGFNMGKSYIETEFVPQALKFYNQYKEKLVLPLDYVCLNGDIVRTLEPGSLSPEDCALDIGDKSVSLYKELTQKSSALLWNGPLGYFEDPRFANATLELCKFISNLTKKGILYSVAGGGDTVAALALDPNHHLSYISTAGGAFLEYLEGVEFDTLKKLH